MEEVYPEGHEEADWGSTVTHWMLVPMPRPTGQGDKAEPGRLYT